MNKWKILALLVVISWSCWVWFAPTKPQANAVSYSAPRIIVDDVIALRKNEGVNPQKLSEDFWRWESRGRVHLIDAIIDDPLLTKARDFMEDDKAIVKELANRLIVHQITAYGMLAEIQPPNIIFTPLRGDANGLYIPTDETIYLNSKMDWHKLSFERLVEVILHENMHHILTQSYPAFVDRDSLKNDFHILRIAAYSPQFLANDNGEIIHPSVNPQELVAYQTQRAARYAGVVNSNLEVWDMTARMQELRMIQEDAHFYE